MARAPILPANKADPTGVDRLERGAMREFDRRMRKVLAIYAGALDRIPVEPTVNERYTFRLDPIVISTLFADIDIRVDQVLLEGGEQGLWFLRAYAQVAYQRGTAQQFANLSQQSPAYKAGATSLDSILASPPYRRRVSLLAAREFEEMKGLSGTVKANMGRILADGIGRGQNPRLIGKQLAEQADIEARRGHKIARTEIPTALRRARMDESDEAAESYGLLMREMHISALSPTTRVTHAARHATLHTTDEQRDWWSKDANSINCKCGTVSVLVDENSQPLVPAIVERAKRNRQVMKARGKGPWANED